MTRTVNDPHPKPRARHLRRGVVMAATVAALVMSGSGAAWAWWTATASVSGTVSTATVPAPTGIGCTSGGFGDASSYLTWTPVNATANPVPAGATRTYVVTITKGTAQTTVTVPDGSTYAQIAIANLPNNGNGTFTMTVKTRYTFPGPPAVTVDSAAIGPRSATVSRILSVPYIRCA